MTSYAEARGIRWTRRAWRFELNDQRPDPSAGNVSSHPLNRFPCLFLSAAPPLPRNIPFYLIPRLEYGYANQKTLPTRVFSIMGTNGRPAPSSSVVQWVALHVSAALMLQKGVHGLLPPLVF